MARFENEYIVCPFCGTASPNPIYKDNITGEQIQRYLLGVDHVQNIFPDMDSDSREQLISGLCMKCIKSMFTKQ